RIQRSDLDWSMALRQAGWLTYYCREVSVVHLGSRSIGRPDPELRRLMYADNYQFYRKHFGPLAWPLAVTAGVRSLAVRVRYPAAPRTHPEHGSGPTRPQVNFLLRA